MLFPSLFLSHNAFVSKAVQGQPVFAYYVHVVLADKNDGRRWRNMVHNAVYPRSEEGWEQTEQFWLNAVSKALIKAVLSKPHAACRTISSGPQDKISELNICIS